MTGASIFMISPTYAEMLYRKLVLLITAGLSYHLR